MDIRLQNLVDRAAISDVVLRYALALDLQDWLLMRSTLADRVTIDYSSFDPTINRDMPADEWVELLRVMAGSVPTQHMSTNHLHAIDGNQAVCRSNMQSARLLSGPQGDYYFTLYGHYIHTLTRLGSGWQITECALMLMPQV